MLSEAPAKAHNSVNNIDFCSAGRESRTRALICRAHISESSERKRSADIRVWKESGTDLMEFWLIREQSKSRIDRHERSFSSIDRRSSSMLTASMTGDSTSDIVVRRAQRVRDTDVTRR
eukprot:1134496_1